MIVNTLVFLADKDCDQNLSVEGQILLDYIHKIITVDYYASV